MKAAGPSLPAGVEDDFNISVFEILGKKVVMAKIGRNIFDTSYCDTFYILHVFSEITPSGQI